MLWQFIARTAGHFKSAATRFPHGVWRRWIITLLIGFVPAAGVSMAVTLLAKAYVDRGLQAWDERGVRWVERHSGITFQNAILLESFGNLAYLIPLTLACFVIATRQGRPIVGLSILVSYWVMRLVVLVGWLLWDRARPTLILGGIAAPPLHSFPSGHVAFALSVYGLLAYLWMQATRSWVERILAAALLLCLLVVVSLARIRLGSHWPSDTIAGGIVGLTWLTVVILSLRRAELASDR